VSERVVDAEVVEERIVVCPQCHRRNRLYTRSAAGVYKCGACRASLPNPFAVPNRIPSLRKIGIATASVIALLVIIIAIGSNSSSRPVAPVAHDTSRAVTALPPIPSTRTYVPQNNEVLFDAYPDSVSRGELTVDNGTSSHAVAKLINIQTDRKILSFVISARQQAAIHRIPDGTYQLLFAFGDQLYVGTDRFRSPHGLSKFVRHLTFDTKATNDAHLLEPALGHTSSGRRGQC